MNSIRHFDNEKLKERTTYLLWLLFFMVGLIGFQLFNLIIKPNRYFSSTTEWVFTFCLVFIFTCYFLFYRRFVSITFDDLNKKIILTTITLFNGEKTNNYNYLDINFNDGKIPASFRKRKTGFIEIYHGKQKLIKIERTNIGEYSFDNILKEFQRLKGFA